MTPRQRLFLIVPGVLFLVAFGAFELGRWGGEKRAERKFQAEKQQQNSESREQGDAKLIDTLLAQNLDDRRFDFPGVVKASTGKTLRPFDPKSPVAQIILGAIRSAADEVLALHNAPESPLKGLPRINEASRFFEDALRARIDQHPDLFCTIPETADGNEQRSGYPDLRIEHVESGAVAYLDPKLFEESSRKGSLRTFYYTPKSKTSKVLSDGYHLLLGISHDGKDGAWTFTGWELIDLAILKVRLKAEFQASNRDLYTDEARIAGSGTPQN